MDVANTEFRPRMCTEPVLYLFGLVGVGIWMQVSSSTSSEHAERGALLLDISGVIVDKPSSTSRLSVIGRQLFGASSDRLQENSLFDIVNTIRQAKDDRNITGIVMDLKTLPGPISRPCSISAKHCENSATVENRSLPWAITSARTVLPRKLCQQNLALPAGFG